MKVIVVTILMKGPHKVTTMTKTIVTQKIIIIDIVKLCP